MIPLLPAGLKVLRAQFITYGSTNDEVVDDDEADTAEQNPKNFPSFQSISLAEAQALYAQAQTVYVYSGSDRTPVLRPIGHILFTDQMMAIKPTLTHRVDLASLQLPTYKKAPPQSKWVHHTVQRAPLPPHLEELKLDTLQLVQHPLPPSIFRLDVKTLLNAQRCQEQIDTECLPPVLDMLRLRVMNFSLLLLTDLGLDFANIRLVKIDVISLSILDKDTIRDCLPLLQVEELHIRDVRWPPQQVKFAVPLPSVQTLVVYLDEEDMDEEMDGVPNPVLNQDIVVGPQGCKNAVHGKWPMALLEPPEPSDFLARRTVRFTTDEDFMADTV
jgi:hypothetical protein